MEYCHRYPRRVTGEAIEALAERFALPVNEYDQDWEYTAGDPSRLEEFLATLERDALTDDERFTLTEMVMQCFEDSFRSDRPRETPPDWDRFVALLRARPGLHAFTLCYWSTLESEPDDAFLVSWLVRPLWAELKPIIDAANEDREGRPGGLQNGRSGRGGL